MTGGGDATGGGVGTSVTPTDVSERFPVLTTVKVYAIGWPAPVTDVGFAVLAMESEGDWVTSTVTWLDVAVTGVSEGDVPAATAVS